MRLNKDRLKADADCRCVAEFIGMRRHGQFCECVSGLHTETQLNHCAIYKDRIHCFSCGDNQDVFGMVRGYYANILGSPIGMQDALRIVGDALGGHEMYMESGTVANTAEQLPFTKEELSLIGLSDPKSGGLTMGALYREDKALYMTMVQENARQTLVRIEELKGRLGSSDFEVALRSALDVRYTDVRRIFKKAGGKKSLPQMFKL